MRSEAGGWIRTFTGRKVWPLDPRESDIDIRDIAHALSLICRFCGHTRLFYSVAQHSLIVADHLLRTTGNPTTALYGLLHDASEAYISDVSRPVKTSAEMTVYRAIERRLQHTVYRAFGLNEPEPAVVKTIDAWVLDAELRDLMTDADPEHAARAADHYRIVPEASDVSEYRFRIWFLNLTAGVARPTAPAGAVQ